MSARTVELLASKDAGILRTFLTRDATHNMYALGILEEFGIAPQAGRAFWGRFWGRELSAVLFVGGEGGLLLPSASDPQEISAIAEQVSAHGTLKLRAALGEKAAVDGLMRHFCPDRPRVSRIYKLYTVTADDLGPFTNPALRLAKERDLPELVEMAACAVRELLDRDPLREDLEGFRARVAQRVRGKRTYVLDGAGKKLLFKIDVGSRSQHGAELEGLYTVPEERGTDAAVLSLGQISRHLLSSLPRLTLRVDDRDSWLAGVARKVGYAPGKSCRLVVRE
ncbi:MAG TPA: DUF4081 domain-containing protein [Myxococcales bacterium]|jgi:predicted GNAT family acetyltransferase|nr:DUF4081 domain-containing protein [Myxococcales bacterium]